MSNAGTQNVLLYCGSMAVLVTFWLVILGLANDSILQLAGAAICLIAAVACFRGYNNVARRERERLEADE